MNLQAKLHIPFIRRSNASQAYNTAGAQRKIQETSGFLPQAYSWNNISQDSQIRQKENDAHIQETNQHALDESSMMALCKINEVLMAQISHVVQETENAAMGILANCKQTGTCVEHATHTVDDVVTKSNENINKENSEIENIEAFMDDLSRYIHERDKESVAQQQSISDIMADTETLTNLTSRVKNIARQTHMLSMNAKIEAARAGEHGVGFAVVAEEVRDLSLTSAKMAENIANGINSFKDSMDERLSVLLKCMDSDNKRLGQVNTLMDQMAHRMTGICHNQSILFISMMADIQKETDTVSMSVMESVASVQFQDITRQELEHIQGMLKHINGYIQEYAHGDNPDPLDVETLSMDYCMSSQRVIHQDITTGNISIQDSRESIELF